MVVAKVIKGIERPRAARFAVGVVDDGVPHDGVVGGTGSSPLGGTGIGGGGRRHVGDDHRPVVVEALGTKPAQHVRRRFAGHLALDQVPYGSDRGATQHHHICEARVSSRLPDDRIGAVDWQDQAEAQHHRIILPGCCSGLTVLTTSLVAWPTAAASTTRCVPGRTR
jgi:hypothetical protein